MKKQAEISLFFYLPTSTLLLKKTHILKTIPTHTGGTPQNQVHFSKHTYEKIGDIEYFSYSKLKHKLTIFNFFVNIHIPAQEKCQHKL